SPDVHIPSDDTTAIPFGKLTENADPGVVDGDGWDESSIQVSSDPNGPFDDDADLDSENSCTVGDDGAIEYTSAIEVEDGESLPTCYVQICELNPGPAGADATDRACGVIELTPKVDNDYVPNDVVI